MLLKEDIYATAAVACGSIGYLALSNGVAVSTLVVIGFASVLVIRGLATSFKLSLPSSDWVHRKLYRHGR